jgi:amino acid adenylation domain-containing protein
MQPAEITIEGFRLSPQQERLWRLRVDEPGHPYHAACAIAVTGEVDPGALRAALRQVIERHEILRTTFQRLFGLEAPLQVIGAEPVLSWREEDLAALAAGEQRRRIDSLLDPAAREPLDLERGPVVRAVLLRRSERSAVLVLILPALCADVATLDNLVREMSGGYRSPAAPWDEPVQYADLAGWQNELLESQDALARKFWQTRGFLQGLDIRLPFERAAGEPGAFAPRRLRLDFADTLAAELDARASASGLPPAVLLLSAWAALMRRLTGRPETVIGVACDGRKFAEMRGALGLFSRYLPLQCDAGEGASFQDLAAAVGRSAGELSRWQEYFNWRSFEEADGGSRFLPYAFEDHELPAEHPAHGASFALDDWSVCTERFRLKLLCLRRGGRIALELHFDAGAVEAGDAGRLAGWFESLLEGALRRPEVSLEDLDILSPAERERLDGELRGPRVDLGDEPTLPSLFRRQAARTPDAIVAVCRDERLTYRELDRWSDGLAWRLRALGVGPEVRVALCVERSLEMVAGILGILKAGGAYVPVDPSYPAARRDFMLEDARAVVLLTREELALSVTAPAGHAGPPPGAPAADNLAYVIYTSGSTGRPKGVMVSHRAIVNRLLWMQRRFPVEAADRVLQKTPYSFDASIWEIFVPLLFGARLVIAEPGGHQDAAYLRDAVARDGVTVLQLVPSFLPLFLDGAERRDLAGLRRLFCGGETLPATLAERCLERLGGELCNLYGPTEAAIDATFHPCGPHLPAATVPIGRPLDNVRLFLLDGRGRRVPPGAPGELYIGGAGLARGYLGRPGLTAERFVPDAWSGGAGSRLYRTGDLARLAAEGDVEFLGRVDHQVKIRGFRIELGEIEVCLRRHPAVREALVVAREPEPGTRRLAAYVVLQAGQEAGVDELRDQLAASLPDYMVPATFTRLPAFPRLPSGKLDLGALPDPHPSPSGSREALAAPRSPAEEILEGVWSSLLRTGPIGVHDDFFAAGGDSLIATQLISRVREIFRVEIRVRALFEEPTIAGLAARIAAARRLDGESGPPALLPVPRDGDPPLSYAQQRLWILDRIEPGSAAYNLSVAVRLQGELDPEALAASLGEIVRRHETLRTTFAPAGDEPVQRIAPFAGFALPRVDLAALGQGAGREARRLAAENAARPFDLAAGPLFRPLLLRLGAEDHVVLAALHHIVSDGWSTGVLVRELGLLYRAARERWPSPLPELRVQYADFARWQRRWLAGATLAAEVEHWRRRLLDLPARLELPADRPRPAVRTPAGAWCPLTVAESLAESLRGIARGEGATLFMLLLGAFAALLARLSGQETFAVGSPIAGRNRLETEGLIGFFVNTLVLRADLGGDPGFRELLSRTRAETLEAYAHQDLPFEKLVEELAPERSLAHTPLFQVMFLLQNAGRIGGELDLPGLTATPFQVPGTVSRFDLTLTLAEAAGALPGTLEYSADLFDRFTVERLAEQLTVLLEGVAADPGRRLSELPLLGAAARQQIAREWNDAGPAVFPLTLLLHELFERQADRTPEAVAVASGARLWTYRELEERSNRVAHRLRALGVGTESRVALCVDRSPEMLAGLLGILKAGGAYVPLDPEYPGERLAFMLEDAGVAAVLAGDGLLDPPAGLRPPRVALTPGDGELAAESAARPASGARPENLAYVLYTSGSTGRPKGVQIPHRAVVNFLGSMQERLCLDGDDALLAVTSLSFDIAGLELFLPLAVGARVAIATREETQDGARLAAALRAAGATVLQATPATWRLLADSGWTAEDGLRGLCGGEALPRELASRLLRAGSPLWNVYGPTETTIWSGATRVSPGEGAVPIGGPLAATGLHVLDRWLQAAPAGVTGELHISGLGLARGYLGRPEQTAERFVPAVWGGQPGERWYRTGDLVRYRPDGLLEFLGRADHQVKVRGFRIELGEIEGALAGHPAVRQAIVHAVDDAGGGRLLAAYVVPAAPPDGEAAAGKWPAELRSFLRERLPPYMVPSAWVVLEAFPLTPNGKVDRRALPRPEIGAAATPAGFELPWTPTQEVLAGIWSEVLGDRRVGLREDFFAIGGHSLLGTQVISRVREALGVELPLRALFERPTVAGLAERIDAERREGRGPRMSAIERVPREGELPLSFSQQRLWFLDRLEPGNPYHNIAGALRLSGRLDVSALAAALREIVRRHEVLRTRFPETAGRPSQVIEPPGPFDLPVQDLGSLPADRREAESRRRISEEARQGFDLAAGPPFRVVLLRQAEEEHLVLFSLHHAAGDAWSFGVLTRELSVLYPALRAGAPSPLPALPVQYVDFAAWQRRNLEGETLADLLAFWRGMLADAPPELALPLDRGRPERTTLEVASLPVAIRGGLRGLRRLGRGQGATLFMTLLAALQLLLGRLSGQTDVVVGSPIANRTRPELEPLIGAFVNTLALRADLSGGPTFGQLLARVAESTLGAYDHQDLPFEKLVEELQPERSLARTPLFQVLFVLQNAPAGPLELPGLTLAPVGVARAGSARFDLTLALAESADGLDGSWEYNPEVLDASTAGRVAGCFEVLLAGLAAGWERPASDLPLLSAAERHHILVDWNAAGRGPRPARLLHELFREQVERRPEAVAVVHGGERVTYGELGRLTAAWAASLRALGVGPEVLVGVLMERSVEMLAGLLAVLEAGGAYLPLDPRYPRERLAFLLADSRAALLLTQEALLPLLPSSSSRVVTVDRGALDGEGVETWRGGAADSDGAAYVIYTSGSTGLPKGVVIRHGSAAALVAWALEAFPAAAFSGVLAATSICFDLSVFELFVPLSAGGTVILAEDALALPELPAAGEVTLINTVPSAMAELARAGAVPPSVRTVCLAGEPLTRELASTVYALPGVEGVYNLYGPSEDTTYSTGGRVERDSTRPPTIGRPLDKARSYLLDGALQPVPVGVIGELWLGGEGLARGYLRRPETTADHFRPDPFAAPWNEPGGRLYRTGDLGRLLSGGEIEFLGRRDHQVKVRGFRIELGEVEAALTALAGVRDAAVVVREDLPGGRGLVAWVVAEEGHPLSTVELREALRRKLPAAMVPLRFTLLATLPRTPNGKLDRQDLARRPLDPGGESCRAPAAPRTPTQELLAGLFAEVLRRDSAGVTESFFDLGGHSLLATQLISRARSAFGVDLPLRALFERPTVAGLAAAIDAALGEERDLVAPPIEPIPRAGGLPLSFAQRRLWFLHRVEPESPAYNLPAAVRLRGSLRISALAAALNEIVRRHEALRATFRCTEIGEPVLVAGPVLSCPLPLVDLKGIPGARDEALRLAREEGRRPFDLARGPVFRGLLIAIAGDEHVALLTMHHIVSDGWSMGVLVRELAALYATALRGEGSPLPELPIQYADFAHWQLRRLAGGALARLAEYWTRSLTGAPPLLELPGARPRPPVQSGRGATSDGRLDAALAQELHALGRRESATLFMILLAAFQALLHARTGETDLVVGTDVANRDREEIEPLIGFFVNQLPLRTQLGGDPTFRELLARVREVALGAYAHQDLPFDRLVDLLKVPRSLASSPIFQVKLVLQNLPAASLELPDLTLSAVDAGAATSQLDLNLRVAESPSGLHLSLQYSTDLYDATVMERLLQQFEELLRAVVARPESTLAELSAGLRETDRSRWTAREQEARGARRESLKSVRRQGTPRNSS